MCVCVRRMVCSGIAGNVFIAAIYLFQRPIFYQTGSDCNSLPRTTAAKPGHGNNKWLAHEMDTVLAPAILYRSHFEFQLESRLKFKSEINNGGAKNASISIKCVCVCVYAKGFLSLFSRKIYVKRLKITSIQSVLVC